jgi:calcineurin-like phosphoesterase family protein
MANLFYISDTHFGHSNILTFRVRCEICDGRGDTFHHDLADPPILLLSCSRCEGTGQRLLRKFACVEEMDDLIVQRWNATVRPQDHVYHLGDVAMHRRSLATVKRCNGHKRLVRGNHDIHKTKEYLEAGFKEIHGVKVHDNVLFSHIPVHPDSFSRFAGNVHGHLHERTLRRPYLSVCVEQTDYWPVSLEDVKKRLAA